MTKAARTTQCTLFSCIPQDQAWTFNTQRSEPDKLAEPVEGDGQKVPNNSNVPYTREIFDALCMRYEEPHSNSRWDSPLVVALPEDTVDWEGIYKSLFETQPLPPNQSTQNVQQTQSQLSCSVSNLLISRSLFAATFGCHELSLRAGRHNAGDYKGNTGCCQNWCLRSTAYQGQLQHRQSDHINECPPAEQVEAKVHNEHVPGQPDDAGAAGTGATVVCAIHQCQYNRLLVIAVRNETKKKQFI